MNSGFDLGIWQSNRSEIGFARIFAPSFKNFTKNVFIMKIFLFKKDWIKVISESWIFTSCPLECEDRKRGNFISQFLEMYCHVKWNQDIISANNSRKSYDIYWKLTIKIPYQLQWCCFGVFINNFEHSLHLFLVLVSSTFNK